MPNVAPTLEPTAIAADRLWREIGGELREACILRRQGRHQAAAAILENELPALIRRWAEAAALPAAQAKAQLNQLFNDEQARVESHWLISRFLAENHAAGPAVRQLAAFPGPLAASVPQAASYFAPATLPPNTFFPAIPPRRIPISDVADMIDAARDLERPLPRSLSS